MKVVALGDDLSKLKTNLRCSQELFVDLLQKYFHEQLEQPEQLEHQQGKLDLFKTKIMKLKTELELTQEEWMSHLKKIVPEQEECLSPRSIP